MKETSLVVYVAGRYRDSTAWRIEENINMAKSITLQLLKAGHTPICPHTMYAHFDGECDDEVFLQAGLRLLHFCQAVVLVPGWEVSKGTQAEVSYARRLGLPICMGVDALDEVLNPRLPVEIQSALGQASAVPQQNEDSGERSHVPYP